MKLFFKENPVRMANKNLIADILMKLTKAFRLAAVLGFVAVSAPSPISTAFSAQDGPQSTPNQNIISLSRNNTDPKAADIARVLYAKQIELMKSMLPEEPSVYARFVSLGPGLPATSVAAMFMHPAVCGGQSCETVLFENTGKNNYRVVMDNNFGDFRLAPAQGQKYFELRIPTATSVNVVDTVWKMDEGRKIYTIRQGPHVGQ